MDQVLINGLLEVVLAGPKRSEKGFKSEYLTKVIEKVREACHISICVDNVRGRLRTLKKECDEITKLFKTSGFGLDSSGRVSADPITWENYIKEKSDGAKMKEKLCPRYYDLLTVFGNDAATGDRAVSGNDFPPMSEPVDDLEGENDVEETQPSHSINSHRLVQGGPPQRRKRTKPMEDAALALAKIAKSSEMIAVAFDKQASQNYVNGQALLERLKEMNIDQGDIMDLMEVFEGDKKAEKFFLEITDLEFRRLWVYRKLGRDPPR
ncbi:Uncharacterized protein M6B38_234860 [Iris pallida]|uniref:Myb/SANT-like domain-containing protein n=1 Tax=Iris pallida TaxID=29817 RepID=A0AAX6DPE2_IRIPA|nr:Uncharacterized protein M6B38_234860 [Iris pallida]